MWLQCDLNLCVGSPHPESRPYRVLGAMGLVNVEIKHFRFVTWPRIQCVTWICGWGSLILSYHTDKFGVHKSWENGDITFFICHVTTILKWPRYWSVKWFCEWGPLMLSHHPAKFGIHRPYGTENNGVCNISSSSNAEIPMLRFINASVYNFRNPSEFSRRNVQMVQKAFLFLILKYGILNLMNWNN